MNLKKVHAHGISIKCCRCSQVVTQEVFADLDGESFKSYYCKDCVEDMERGIETDVETDMEKSLEWSEQLAGTK